jgi:alpha-tubulin suppressor-like RCC1 family protein
LGTGSEISKAEPSLIEELNAYHVKQISTSGISRSSAALTSNGKVFTWGNGMDGVLGHRATDSNILIPTLVDSLDQYTFDKISVGTGHMVALTAEGTLFSWGLNDNG